MVDNAYFQCRPPEKSANTHKVRPPMLEYIRRLILVVLTERTTEAVFDSLRRLNWSDPTTEQYCVRVLSRPWALKFSGIHNAASVLSGIMSRHDGVAISVVDNIIESIKRGLELNDYRRNQRRVAVMRYLGELYNYSVIESDIVFDMLYLLLSFGHPGGRAVRGKAAPLDLPDDFFRLRLITTLLDTCGEYFDVGRRRVALNRFFDFFAVHLLYGLLVNRALMSDFSGTF